MINITILKILNDNSIKDRLIIKYLRNIKYYQI
jgi:hypothetical protein